MRPLNILHVSLIAVILGLAFPCGVDATNVYNSSCDCTHCDVENVASIEDKKPNNDTADDDNVLNLEDSDGNVNRTICARDRDEEDHTFPSICHMMCNNECTRFRIWIYKENDVKKYTAVAYRTNFYKLYDGPC